MAKSLEEMVKLAKIRLRNIDSTRKVAVVIENSTPGAFTSVKHHIENGVEVRIPRRGILPKHSEIFTFRKSKFSLVGCYGIMACSFGEKNTKCLRIMFSVPFSFFYKNEYSVSVENCSSNFTVDDRSLREMYDSANKTCAGNSFEFDDCNHNVHIRAFMDDSNTSIITVTVSSNDKETTL